MSDEHSGVGIDVMVGDQPGHIIGFTTGDEPRAIVMYCDGTFAVEELEDLQAVQ